jgi:hypothetical protein
MARAPVIILGMHRSGTTMLARALERLGLYIGGRGVDEDGEAVFFRKINDWMLSCANASWDAPRNFQSIDESCKDHLLRVARGHLRGLRRIKYLGLKRSLVTKDIGDLRIPWGWKDPRNTITMDIWNDIFPQARLVHIHRNPVDVAESMRVGQERSARPENRKWTWPIKELLLKRVDYQVSVRTRDLRQGVELWEEYVGKALELDKSAPGRIMHVKYETLLDEPERTLGAVLEFIGLEAGGEGMRAVVRGVDPTRKNAFLEREDLRRLFQEVRQRPLARALGYGDLPI